MNLFMKYESILQKNVKIFVDIDVKVMYTKKYSVQFIY